MISIIIPVYNAEHTLQRCVDSVLAQTYTDFELILVDDGSNDSTAVLYNMFKDNRIRVYRKVNGGVSSARNMGLDKAKGDYVCFIDADDYVECDYLAKLYRGVGKDLVISGFCYGNVPECSSFRFDLMDREFVGLKMSELINADQLCYPWGRLFKRSVIETFHIRFDESMRFAEDNVFNWEYLCHAESLYVDTTHKVYYKSSDEKGEGYGLSFEEIDYIDGRLFELSQKLEQHYQVPLRLDAKQLMHVLFLKDMLQLTASQWYEYYQKYHPNGTEKEGYSTIMETIYYMSLVDLSKSKNKSEQKEQLAGLRKFIDKPFLLLFRSTIKTRFLIPFIKLKLDGVVLRMIGGLNKVGN